jgi:hypothetical protein
VAAYPLKPEAAWKRLRLKVATAASTLAIGAASLSGCGIPSPRLEYSTKSPNGRRTALVAVEPNVHGFGLMSVVFEPPKEQRDIPWGEIQVLYHAKLGWLDDTTFAIIGDEIMYGQRKGNDYSDVDYPGGVVLITCVRKKSDCSHLEKEFQPNALYVPNFQSALATYEERTDRKPIVQVLPPS